MSALVEITKELEIDIIGKLIKRTGEEIEELSSRKVIGKKVKKELDLLISYNMFLGKVLKLKTKKNR
jgi:hypothetical protein